MCNQYYWIKSAKCHRRARVLTRARKRTQRNAHKPTFQDELLEADTHLDKLATLLSELNPDDGMDKNTYVLPPVGDRPC